MTEFLLPIRVYYEDTDVAGVVYHANYLKFLERARTEWLRALGLDQKLLIEQDIAFAVVKAELSYLKPARFNDRLMVSSRVSHHGRASMTFEQKIYLCLGSDEKLTETNTLTEASILNEAEIKVACVTLSTMKPRTIPEVLREEFNRAI